MSDPRTTSDGRWFASSAAARAHQRNLDAGEPDSAPGPQPTEESPSETSPPEPSAGEHEGAEGEDIKDSTDDVSVLPAELLDREWFTAEEIAGHRDAGTLDELAGAYGLAIDGRNTDATIVERLNTLLEQASE